MDPTVIAAVVGGVATIGAAIVGIWAKNRSESKSKELAQSPSESRNTVPAAENSMAPPATPNFRRYKVTFLTECENDLATLKLDKSALIKLVESEFLGHMNYFVYDLEEYAMPVKAKYIVHIDKIDEKLTFKRIFSCTANEAKLTSWNDILTLYRRATRLAYRDKPEDMLLIQSMLPRTRQIHIELVYRIVKHFSTYEGLQLSVDPVQIISVARIELQRRKALVNKLITDNATGTPHPITHYPTTEQDAKTKEIDFHLRQSVVAWIEVEEIQEDLEDGLITEQAALGALITSAERSLQFIHKLLLIHPPIA